MVMFSVMLPGDTGVPLWNHRTEAFQG
uniref:Uncharacterized protein n=1 Tax=Anguilla anguilla TaxID=7936 RepID=A0A0E9R5X1_ANGAN